MRSRKSTLILVLLALVAGAWLFQRCRTREPLLTPHQEDPQRPPAAEVQQSSHQPARAVNSQAQSARPPQNANRAGDTQPRPRPQSALPPREKPDMDSILNFFNSLNDRGKAKGAWRVSHGEQGEVIRVVGGEIFAGTENEEAVRELMAEIGPEFGVPSDQVTAKIEHDDTAQFDLYDSVQQVDGLPVFEGYFRVIGNKETNHAFMFNNSLKPVAREQVAIPAPLSMGQAEKILRDLYGARLKEIRARTGPVVWASESPHQTAYVFDITVTDNDYKVVIGAQSGQRLLERSTRMH